MAERQAYEALSPRAILSANSRQNRTFTSDIKEPHHIKNLLPANLFNFNIKAFVDRYNHQNHHKIIHKVTPAEVYFGRYKAILDHWQRIKRTPLETLLASQAARCIILAIRFAKLSISLSGLCTKDSDDGQTPHHTLTELSEQKNYNGLHTPGCSWTLHLFWVVWLIADMV